MENTSKSGSRNRRPQAVHKVVIHGHKLNLTAGQILADKDSWTHCHGKVGNDEVRSLSIKRMGDKIMVRDGQGALVGCFDENEFAVAAKTYLSTMTDASKIVIGAKA